MVVAIPDKSQVSAEPFKHSPEIKFPAAPELSKAAEEYLRKQEKEENAREGSAPVLKVQEGSLLGDLAAKEHLQEGRFPDGESLDNPKSYMFRQQLQEGSLVHYLTPNDWLPNARKQIRAALVVFCYRDAQGAPTGTVNLCIFLNGPQDTGDMLGPKTRCLQFEPGVKFSAEPAGGGWSLPSKS